MTNHYYFIQFGTEAPIELFKPEPKTAPFGEVLICWDCKKQLPEEKDQYQHSNLWPLCKPCAERREEIKLQILRKMARRVRDG